MQIFVINLSIVGEHVFPGEDTGRKGAEILNSWSSRGLRDQVDGGGLTIGSS